jgi:hypothetical protein
VVLQGGYLSISLELKLQEFVSEFALMAHVVPAVEVPGSHRKVKLSLEANALADLACRLLNKQGGAGSLTCLDYPGDHNVQTTECL